MRKIKNFKIFQKSLDTTQFKCNTDLSIILKVKKVVFFYVPRMKKKEVRGSVQ